MSKKMSSGKNGNGRVPVILIYADYVRIEYAAYLFARLTILSPPIEVEESDDYYEYSYGIKVNDDWGIYLQRYGKAI